MAHNSCCVVNCKNTGVNSNFKFYRFPIANHKLEQRKKWIAAVKRINPDGSPWYPKPSHKICSEHFVGNKKSEEQLSPSYVPTKFPFETKVINETAVLNRYNRLRRRILNTSNNRRLQNKSKTEKPVLLESMELETNCLTVKNETQVTDNQKTYIDQACQANIYFECYESTKTFVCNRYANNSSYADAEIQTEILEILGIIKIPNRRKYKDKECNTDKNIFVDQSVGSSFKTNDFTNSQFSGIKSIKADNDLLNLAGVTFDNFKFLLQKIETDASDNCKISKENRLLIFLIKMKTGLSHSAIGVLFSVHRTTISRIFSSTLRDLARSTADVVLWPSKDIVQETMPKCFYPNYSNTRVIIDCTEFRIEIPASVDKRVDSFSHSNNGFTAKILIGITPGGLISFKSKVAGGRKSDSQITIESGLIDLLEDGDVVLANKDFPEIRKIIDKSDKNVVLVIPPFLENQSQFTQEQTKQTYSAKSAKVRIHIERIMQRLRTYQILNKIPEHFFNCIDDILHMCCVLVNLQSPTHSNNNK